MGDYKELVILIAEDDDGHAELIREGLVESGVCNEMIRFRDGQDVLEFLLTHERQEKNAYLLLLDINMPRMNGIEVLKRIKTNDNLKNIPVIMLTTTDDPREVNQCYELGCNVYITKPVDFFKLSETLNRLGLFIQIVKL